MRAGLGFYLVSDDGTIRRIGLPRPHPAAPPSLWTRASVPVQQTPFIFVPVERAA
jgi:hypothetical protein